MRARCQITVTDTESEWASYDGCQGRAFGLCDGGDGDDYVMVRLLRSDGQPRGEFVVIPFKYVYWLNGPCRALAED